MSPSTTAVRKERTPRSFWFDPRFAIGLALVVASVLGVLTLVATADNTVLIYAARTALNVGDHIDADDLAEQGVRLGTSTDKYLASGELPSDGLIVTKSVARGELVPASAVGSAAGNRVASVVVTVSSQLPASVGSGSVVDLWAASETDAGHFGPPSVLVSSATVVRVIEADGIIAGANSPSVEVLVPRSRIARVLGAIANQDAVSLVPVNLPATTTARTTAED